MASFRHDACVQRTFDELLDEQPSIVADTGCGDGLLLKVFMRARPRRAFGNWLRGRC